MYRPDGHRPDPARALARLGPDPPRREGAATCSAVREGYVEFWRKLDRGVGEIVDALPADTAVILISDHGFGPIEWYVNFNVWLLQRGDIALQDSFYVKQKKWFYDRGRDARSGSTSRWSGSAWRGSGSAGSGASRRAGSSGWPSRRSSRGGTSTGRGRRRTPRGISARSSSTRRAASRRGASRPRTSGRYLDDLKAGPARDPASRDGRAAGRVDLRARRAVPRPARPPRARPDGRPQGLAIPDDRPARLHDQHGDRPGLRPDRRPPDRRAS